MTGQARGWVLWAVLGVAMGLGLGFAIGWWWWPVEYTNTAPDVLRRDYRDDYIVMIAATYEVEGDLELAYERLKRLNPANPAAPVVELAERLVRVGGSVEDTARLAHLAADLGVATPSLSPYLESYP